MLISECVVVDEDVLLKAGGGEVGKVLCQAANGHFWCENAVEGVTDVMAGRKFVEGSKSQEMGR